MWKSTTVAVVAIILLATPSVAQQETVTGIAKVIDGDTLQFGNKKVNLVYFDAPELEQRCHNLDFSNNGSPRFIEPFDGGKFARQALIELIAGQPVTCKIVSTSYINNGECSTSTVGSLSNEMARRGMGYPVEKLSTIQYEDKSAAASAWKTMYKIFNNLEGSNLGIYTVKGGWRKCFKPSDSREKGDLW